MREAHFIEKCKHGSVVQQCRCPSKNKTIRWSACIFTSCTELGATIDKDWPGRVIVELQQATDQDLATQNLIKSLHLLLAKMHLESAGQQTMSPDEWKLMEDISDWYIAHKELRNVHGK